MSTLIPLIALVVLFALTMVARLVMMHGSAKKTTAERTKSPGATVIRVDRNAVGTNNDRVAGGDDGRTGQD